MAKVLGMHSVELKPRVNEQEFEEFIKTNVLPVYRKVPGQTVHLLKGDRGVAEDVQQLVGNVDPIWEKFSTFVEGFPDPAFTDYVMVSD